MCITQVFAVQQKLINMINHLYFKKKIKNLKKEEIEVAI